MFQYASLATVLALINFVHRGGVADRMEHIYHTIF